MFWFYSSAVVLCLLMTRVYIGKAQDPETTPETGAEVTAGEVAEDFCSAHKQKPQTIDSVFIIWDDIYFGDGKKFWTFNAQKVKEDKTLSPKTQVTARDIFPGSPMSSSKSALFFNQITCTESEPDCVDSKKIENRVLEFGHLMRDKLYGWQSYTTSSATSKITQDTQVIKLAWGLVGRLAIQNSEFWPQPPFNFSGFTYESKSMIIVMSGFTQTSDSEVKNSFVYKKQIQSSGKIDELVKMEAKRVYQGLVNFDEKIYGFGDNKFFLLSIGETVEETEEYTIEEFFNCDGKSPLTGFVKPKPNSGSENDTVTTEATVHNSDGSPNSGTKSSEEEGKSMNWIIIIVIVLIIIAILIGICLCIAFRKKSKATDEEGAKGRTGASKPSGVGAKAGASKMPATGGSSRGGSGVASKAGGKGSLSMKSTKSTTSVRSRHD